MSVPGLLLFAHGARDPNWALPFEAVARIVRSEILALRTRPFVDAAVLAGATRRHVIGRHILPAVLPQALIAVVLLLPHAIWHESTLSFLGFGLPPGSASLGELLAQGKNNPRYPWLGITGFLVLSVMLILMIFIGEGMRDAINPYKGRRGNVPALGTKTV